MLADAGLIERQGIEGGRPGAFVLALTPEGRRVAMGELRPELALPVPARRAAALARALAAVARRRSPATGGQPGACGGGGRPGTPRPAQGLAHRRRPDDSGCRRTSSSTTARSRRSPPAATGPQALRRVPGIGPAKLEAYGEALLELLGKAEKSLARPTG